MKLRWTGTDVLYRLVYPKGTRFRFKIKIFFERRVTELIQYFIEGNEVVSTHLIKELEQTGIKKNFTLRPSLPVYTDIDKTPHSGFNVIYYRPEKKNQEFIDWLYGYDIVREIKRKFPKYNFIRVDGSQDMTKIYPITDFYLRPNRHDGEPRMIMECKCLGIPYYHSKSVPDVGHIIDKLNLLRRTK